MRRAAKVLPAVVLGLLAGVTLMLVWPLATGGPSRIVIVSGHSMDPTFHTGDLIIAWPSDDYQQGQVVPYQVPDGQPGEGGRVIHRIVGGNARDGFVMQGDNNPTPDIWTPRAADMIGRKVLLVPKVGLLMAWIRQPMVVAALAAGLITSTLLLGRKPEEGRQEAEGGADGDAVGPTPPTQAWVDLTEGSTAQSAPVGPAGRPCVQEASR